MPTEAPRPVPRSAGALAAVAVVCAASIGLGAASQIATTAPPAGERLEEAVRLRDLALAEMENEQYRKAVEHLERLAEILPENVLPPINLAICYSRLDRPTEALRQAERARTLDPDNANMLYTLARLLEEDRGAGPEWRSVIRHFAAVRPQDVRPYYLEAEALARERRYAEAIPLLERGLGIESENLVLLADLVVAAAASGDFAALTDALNGLEDRLDGFEGNLETFASELRERTSRRESDALLPPALVLRNLLRPEDLYQVHLAPLVGGRRLGGGMFPQLDFQPPLPEGFQGGHDIAISFADSTSGLPQAVVAGVVRAVVPRGPDRDALLATHADRLVAWTDGSPAADLGRLTSVPGDLILLSALDGDELPDLLIASAASGITLHPGLSEQAFGPAIEIGSFEQEPSAPLRAVFPLDLDHDGDLDLFVARAEAPDLYFQNNGDGSWTEKAEALGIAGRAIDTTWAAAADFDDDGDLDFVTAHPGSHPNLYLNPRIGPFSDATQVWGMVGIPGADRVQVGDLDNDGLFDLALWGRAGAFLLNNRGARFEVIELPDRLARPWSAAALADFDNDGDLDVIVALDSAPEPKALLIRNRRPRMTVEETEIPTGDVARMLPGDFDDDGDLDLLVSHHAGGNRLWRNDGGNRNHWLRLVLKGRLDNNSKNNVQGLHCRIEARSGGAFQTILGNGGVNHLGLGDRRQAEVLRVIWTNGIAQLWQLVGSDRTLVEEQMLKGSCPFLYAWDGRAFEFVTDLMWKSPLGMILADGRPAPHQSARDFVLVPGEALQPAGHELWLQVTAELWETIYVDRQSLFAVDHPESVELVVDESFRPPPYPSQMPAHWIDETLPPRAAIDHHGRDVLAEISRRDAVHVDQLPLTRYQGLTDGHSLTLSFGVVPADRRLRLLLWGWIFPTDTSINFALAQDRSRNPAGPSLEMLEPDGSWTLIEPFIGFPSGKRKAMVIELGNRPGPGELTLRIATSLQIYWDAAAVAVGEYEGESRIARLEPVAADLHYRGFSKLLPRSPSGPHLFDYSAVAVGPRFRDMTGAFTRYGQVAELLLDEDDRTVVMNAGDEMTIRYDTRGLAPLPPKWRRDWVLYTDGWVKDADIHTVRSQTVAPLPYHGQQGYPASPLHDYPSGPDHRRYLEEYQTRQVDGRKFSAAIRDASIGVEEPGAGSDGKP